MPRAKGFVLVAFLAASIILTPTTSPAADSTCDKPRNDFDGLYCLGKVYQQADVDLNAAFSRLRDKLDAAGRDTVRASQLAWLRERDESCSRHEETGFYVNLECATKTTIARTAFLQNRYRECISSGCMNSRLGSTE